MCWDTPILFELMPTADLDTDIETELCDVKHRILLRVQCKGLVRNDFILRVPVVVGWFGDEDNSDYNGYQDDDRPPS